MITKIKMALISLILAAMGVISYPEAVHDIVNLVVSSAQADDFSHSDVISDTITASVGALRPPSAYSKADRSCYYCHGFHGSKYANPSLTLGNPLLVGVNPLALNMESYISSMSVPTHKGLS